MLLNVYRPEDSLTILKMSILPKLIYRINKIVVNIYSFFMELDKLILK